MEGSFQCSNAYTGYGPNCLTHGESFINYIDEQLIPMFPQGMDYIFILEEQRCPLGVGVLYQPKQVGILRCVSFFLLSN